MKLKVLCYPSHSCFMFLHLFFFILSIRVLPKVLKGRGAGQSWWSVVVLLVGDIGGHYGHSSARGGAEQSHKAVKVLASQL